VAGLLERQSQIANDQLRTTTIAQLEVGQENGELA